MKSNPFQPSDITDAQCSAVLHHPGPFDEQDRAAVAADFNSTPSAFPERFPGAIKTSLVVIGRRWHQKTYGNTYHTAEIIVDGVTVHKTPREYGYGSQYEESAAQWLEVNGYITRKQYANGGTEPLWQIVRDQMGLIWQSKAVDVSRERDL